MPEKLSAIVITLNEENNLGACLRSLAFADEIVVADCGSTDRTVEIATELGARVVSGKWTGFGPFKRWAAEQASHDWILSLDADETITPELQASIISALNHPEHGAWLLPRRNRFMGRWLRHGEGYPDWCLRLFDRRRAQWSDDAVHEKVLTDATPGKLKGDLLHQSEQGIADYLAKQNRYTSLQAERLAAAGKRPGLGKMLLSPPLRFIKFYFLRLGFLDGLPGLVHISIGCFNSFIKYVKTRELLRPDHKNS
ncbi:MAG: glycosyltransferase family 2 protein [Gammaproteobacteria bacterium]|nr:MAG: glycosyltransferase family 2 protein [Gammaproteobacteria bacterium]